MSLFSQRKGIRPLEKSMQKESMDDALRYKIWSALTIVVWDRWRARDYMGYQSEDSKAVELLVETLWLHYFCLPIDSVPSFKKANPKSAYEIMREYCFEHHWWEVYDYVECIAKHIPPKWHNSLRQTINNFLEIENAAYRMIDDEIVEITDETEIVEIESAINSSIKTVRAHIEKSVELLSDRKKPDYRNSVKEAISAVEAACQALSGKRNASLGDCIKELKDKQPLHPAFEQAL